MTKSVRMILGLCLVAQLVYAEPICDSSYNWVVEACLKKLEITSDLSKLLSSYYSTYCVNDPTNVNSTGCIFAKRNKDDKQATNFSRKKRDASLKLVVIDENVYLNVYNLFETHPSLQFLKCIDPTFTLNEIYHTSITYKSKEFYYGFEGLQIREDGNTTFGLKRKQIAIYQTNRTVEYYERLIKTIAELGKYTPEKYDFFEFNCNSFTGTVIKALKYKAPIHQSIQDTVIEASKTKFGKLLKEAVLKFKIY